MNLKCLFAHHKWNNCKCTQCGTIRDKCHSWNGYKCTVCGRKRTTVDLQEVRNITDQTLLREIIQHDEDTVIVFNAAGKLTDRVYAEKIYASIAIFASLENETLSVLALRELTDQRLIYEVAENSANSYVVRDAVYMLTDEDYLNRIMNSTLIGRYRYTEIFSNNSKVVIDLREVAKEKFTELKKNE
jgi:hypothetical protein